MTNYFGASTEQQSTAISNLAIAISGMRFFPNYGSAVQLLVDAFEDAKIGLEQQLGFLPQHKYYPFEIGDLLFSVCVVTRHS